MKSVAWIAFVMAAAVWPATVTAQEHPTYETLWDEASRGAGCGRSDYADLVLVTCDLTLWYFTKTNHPAHPGVIKRMIAQQADGSWTSELQGSSFAPDAAQPAFKAWLAQIADLDRQMREALNNATQPSPDPN